MDPDWKWMIVDDIPSRRSLTQVDRRMIGLIDDHPKQCLICSIPAGDPWGGEGRQRWDVPLAEAINRWDYREFHFDTDDGRRILREAEVGSA